MKTESKQKNIPGGWGEIAVGKVFSFLKSYAISRENLINGTSNNEGIGNIHYGDIHSTYRRPSIDLKEVSVPLVKDKEFTPKSEDFLRNGDLIMADVSEDYAGVGVTVSVHGLDGKRVVGGLHTFVLRDTRNKTIERYRQYIFRNPNIRNKLQKIANGVSVYGISKTNLSNLFLILPPIPEQKRIVAVLEVWDLYLEKLARKIEIKKNIKKGLMQQLLTGKKRLKGFTGLWKSTTLKKVGHFFKGEGISKAELVENGFKAVRYGELYTRHHIKIKKIFSFITKKTAENAVNLKKGDIAFAGSGETIDEIGKSAVYLDNDDCYVGGDVIVLRVNTENDAMFLAFYLNSLVARKELRKMGQGQSVVHIYKKDLEKLTLNAPALKEQTAIANILTKADDEIECLEQKKKFMEAQKKFLLNNLVTGKIRTPEGMKV